MTRRNAIGMAPRYTMAVALLALLAACTNPGLRVKEGGSAVWTTGTDVSPETSGRVGENPDYRVVVETITPALVRGMRATAAETPAPAPARLQPPRTEYRIGPGDIISVVVWGHPELTSPSGPGINQSAEDAGRLVRADGTVFYPFVGVTKVQGMTVEEVRAKFQDALKRVLTDPQVDVRVVAYRSQRVVVTSDLGNSCLVPVTDKPLTVLDVLGQCAVSSNAAGQQSTLYYTSAILTRAGSSHSIDLTTLYRGGTSEAGSIPLQDGDRLHFVDNRANRVFMVGEIDKQLALTLPVKGYSLADAIAEAGGLRLDTANAGRIYVIRGFVGEGADAAGNLKTRLEPVIYQLDASSVDALLLADQFRLQPRDVVFASSATLVNWNRALAQIVPSLNTLFQTKIIFDR
jgi:polysaccharide export outer membrane protein